MQLDHDLIYQLLEQAKNSTSEQREVAVRRAENGETLDYLDIALLLEITEPELLARIYRVAGNIKKKIYGNRVVLFAPLYVSNHCVNNCVYCGFQRCNEMPRRRLTREEIQQEVRVLERMGHKRLALEAGEDPVNCDIQYILDALDAIYDTKLDNGSIRRVNVNIAATTVEEYRMLHEKGIGTYILFQETYHKPTYEAMHPHCRKSNYDYHLTAFDRAMEAGIEDVGAGVLFGLYDPKFEVLGLMMHNAHLEERFGVGFHTISMPRLKQAEGMSLKDFPHLVDDETFKHLVAILRIAVPYTGIIMSTRESAQMRDEVLHYGVSQISAGSNTVIGGYKQEEDSPHETVSGQFQLSDERRPLEVIKTLIENGYIPSYCTACYRQGRTGDRFMQLAKSGTIQNTCTPNALMTLLEYMLDYGDPELTEMGGHLLENELNKIENPNVQRIVRRNIERMRAGERDLFL